MFDACKGIVVQHRDANWLRRRTVHPGANRVSRARLLERNPDWLVYPDNESALLQVFHHPQE